MTRSIIHMKFILGSHHFLAKPNNALQLWLTHNTVRDGIYQNIIVVCTKLIGRRAKKKLAFTAFIMADVSIKVSGSTATSLPHHIHTVHQNHHKTNSFIRKADGSLKGVSGTKQCATDKLQTNRHTTCGTTAHQHHNAIDTNGFSAEENKWYNIPMRWRSTHPGDIKCRKKSRHSWHITDSATANIMYV